jgi:molecular chaperone HtpG
VDGDPTELLATRVDLSGLMRVLGNNLYSTRRVVVRELVQNAHDSCERRRIEAGDTFEPWIAVEADPVHGILAITDNGAGLTHDEIVDYLATVGRGYTGRLRESGHDANLIGAFGLGFLSAYFVSDRVEVHTTSFQDPAVGWHFSSHGGERYQLRGTEPRDVGTRVVLHLDDASRTLCEHSSAREILTRYCALLPIPIHFGRDGPINVDPPWRTPLEADAAPGDRVAHQRACLAFAQRHEEEFEPLCTIEVHGQACRGLLWIQDGWTYGTTDHRHISVYVRGMRVTDDARTLLPAWAGFVGGVIESDRLTPTASREELQRDAVWHTAAEEVAATLISGLAEVAHTDAATWRRILQRHGEHLLGAAVASEALFDLLAEDLRVPTSEGELTLQQIQARGDGAVYVSLGEQGGYEEVLFRALRTPVVSGVRYGAMPFCASWVERRGGRLVKLGTREGNRALFPPATLPEADADRLRALLGAPGREVVATRFEPPTLPVVLVPDRDAALKQRLAAAEDDRKMSEGVLTLVRMFTDEVDEHIEARLYVNLDAPAVEALLRVPESKAEAAGALMRAMAEMVSSRADDAVHTDFSDVLESMTDALLRLIDTDAG